jgi:hypothetical protein
MTVSDEPNKQTMDRTAEAENRNEEGKSLESSTAASKQTNANRARSTSAASGSASQSNGSSILRNEQLGSRGDQRNTEEPATLNESTSVNGDNTGSKERFASDRCQKTNIGENSATNKEHENNSAHERNTHRRSFTGNSVTKPIKTRTTTKRRTNASEISVDRTQSGRGTETNAQPGPANPKRNQDFHALFRSVPIDDFLIDGMYERMCASKIPSVLRDVILSMKHFHVHDGG